MIRENAYAKLNLSLKVLGKMENGFHELETIMVPIVDLYDELYFEENGTNEFVVQDCEIENNSILKAATIFQQKYQTKGANIRLVKRIPLEAGLAGGSADSSATLRGLNRLFNLNIPLKELEELASSLGSDNAFCLYNKAAICTGRGEKLEFINTKFEFNVVLIKPTFGILTKDVFKNLIKSKTFKDQKDILEALENLNYELLDSSIFNDLLVAALKVEPKLGDIKKEIEKHNIRCHMSGSGSTLYLVQQEIDESVFKGKFEYVYLKKHTIKNDVND